MYRTSFAIGMTIVSVVSIGGWCAAGESSVSIQPEAGKFRVLVGDELFCEVDYQTYAKPIVYPIYGPGQVPMTRNYPMQQGVSGEATDHPHHKSMWFAHGDVNGVSFWDEKGKIVNEQAEVVGAAEVPDSLRGQPTVRLRNRLVAPEGTQVCRETVIYSFGANDTQRWIDWQVTTHADLQPITFGDTKEGTAALRVHPNLRPDNRATRDTDIRPARAVNSQGDEGEAIWGKRAKWVDYAGTVNGRRVGIAFLDHPQNLRHPTYWHARSYGLFAANPFGLSYFAGEGQDGAHTVPAGQSLELRYRVVFHTGDADQADVEQLYRSYAGQTE
jgi:hypothetical protein